MGRIKLPVQIKKKTIFIKLEDEVFNDLDLIHPKSKSYLIKLLLKQHFNILSKPEQELL